MTVTLFMAVAIWLLHTSTGCSYIQLSGAKVQHETEGVYRYYGECFSVPAYRLDNSYSTADDYYLYVYDEGNGLARSWQVAKNYCYDARPALYVMTDSGDPINIDAVWQEKELETKAYFNNTAVQLRCEVRVQGRMAVAIYSSFMLVLALFLAAVFLFTWKVCISKWGDEDATVETDGDLLRHQNASTVRESPCMDTQQDAATAAIVKPPPYEYINHHRTNSTMSSYRVTPTIDQDPPTYDAVVKIRSYESYIERCSET